jgi:hypothetical protein
MEASLPADDAVWDWMSGRFFESERVLETETRLSDRKRGIDFGYYKDEIESIPINEIPEIRRKLVLYLFDEVCRSIKVECFLPAREHSQHSIETDEMIDMGVRDEDMLQTVDLSRRQIGKIAEVEEDGMFFEQRFDIQGRIAFPPVQQAGMQERAHGGPSGRLNDKRRPFPTALEGDDTMTRGSRCCSSLCRFVELPFTLEKAVLLLLGSHKVKSAVRCLGIEAIRSRLAPRERPGQTRKDRICGCEA